MIHTYTGRVVDLNALTVGMISIEDVAHHLSHICRYGGATKFHYSVAQHSIYVSRACPPELALAGLLHDAAEYVINDMTHDLKHSDEMKGYRLIEYRVERVIARAFGLEVGQFNDPIIKLADRRLAVTERRDLFNYQFTWPHPEYQVAPFTQEIESWTPYEAKVRFLDLYFQLRSDKA